MSMYECNRCGGAVGLFCVCSRAALAQPAPVQAGAQQAADEPIAVVVERDGQRGRFVCETIFGFTPFVGAKLYDAPVQQDADALEYKFSCLLDHATGGKLSKSSWALSTMQATVDEYIKDREDAAIAERVQQDAPAPSMVGDAKGGA